MGFVVCGEDLSACAAPAGGVSAYFYIYLSRKWKYSRLKTYFIKFNIQYVYISLIWFCPFCFTTFVILFSFEPFLVLYHASLILYSLNFGHFSFSFLFLGAAQAAHLLPCRILVVYKLRTTITNVNKGMLVVYIETFAY